MPATMAAVVMTMGRARLPGMIFSLNINLIEALD
jgi:hypothetical protein